MSLISDEQLFTCENGHRFKRKGSCRLCPECERQKSIPKEFLSLFSAPARRALEANGVTALRQLCGFTKKEVSAWHGIGKNALTIIIAELDKSGLTFMK